MKKGRTVLLAALVLAGACAGCGGKENAAEENSTEVVAVSEAALSETDFSLVAGNYTFEEQAMGGAFTVPWKLELKEDGTYVLTEENPVQGTLTYEGSYILEGDVVVTGPFEGAAPQATFFESDKSCRWTLEGADCTPVNYSQESEELPPLEEGVKGEKQTGENTVAYASLSASQVCDIYTPEQEGTYPVIVLVHGGGFKFGDQAMELIQPVIEAGLENGYAVVSVDYRKSGEAVFPAALADVKAAVRFVRANAEEYGLDTEHIAIWGESAGAYLSLMTALTPEVEELDGDVADNAQESSAVTALVDFYGPVEFYTMDEEYAALGNETTSYSSESSFESAFLGQAVGEDQEKTYETYWETYKESLPEDYTLHAWIQVGNADENVPYTQSENFAARLSEVIGAENVSYSVIEGAAHEDAAFYTEENLSEVFAFLDAVMK